MTIEIRPLQESDIPTFVHVELDAFKPHPRTPIMWPRGYTSDLYAFSEAGKRKGFLDGRQRYMKAVDTTTDVIVGVTEWTFNTENPKDYGQQELPDQNAQPPSNWPIGGNWILRQWYKGNIKKILNERVAGEPFIMLDNLTILPAHQGRGIGSLLLSWGVEQADRLGCKICLESTPIGLAIYHKFGFEEVEDINCDMRKVAGVTVPYDDESARRIFMVRPARKST
ncbi:acyl-CoA N-acyltransferase [Polychaeton citri CBS 116435]|uniref:Acyl-CoA N-acyltransferase n=1 Tax=Polychaeton citri CBS 116435 TaxID=1314669 RepID=A0A9P4PXL0_9PEZI|nr:acyl-CoA N-acyltransferase [Polychaeton citri CBS 116435]